MFATKNIWFCSKHPSLSQVHMNTIQWSHDHAVYPESHTVSATYGYTVYWPQSGSTPLSLTGFNSGYEKGERIKYNINVSLQYFLSK